MSGLVATHTQSIDPIQQRSIPDRDVTHSKPSAVESVQTRDEHIQNTTVEQSATHPSTEVREFVKTPEEDAWDFEGQKMFQTPKKKCS